MRDFLKLIPRVSIVDGKMDSFLYLRPSLTLNEPLHDHPPYDLDDEKVRQSLAFSHSLDPIRTFVGLGSNGRVERTKSPAFVREHPVRSGQPTVSGCASAIC